ncbi:methyl-accepting chemotaxis protein [Psychrosphaera aestuarii]|uniref:methyl-accepting chemotaxis protein n=1 Tax=Psychrosphaera aestuarii TaxID=1266052 RepID=UPI001B32EEED|nr:methyl-accepting chemotaxis protein [Psychrosphaera aestuarii]
MRIINQSIALQLVFWTVLPLFILSIIVGTNHVFSVKEDTVKRVESGINDIVERNAMEIKSFFEAKGQVIHSVFASPQVKNWFSDYNNRGGDLSSDQDYQQIVRYFRYFSDQDATIKSVFFGSGNTFEYFDLNGRHNDPSYYTHKRPWWPEAQNKGRLYVSDPAVDANDGSINATVKTPIYDDNRKLIGVAGVDILISTIGEELLSKIKYEGEGFAFLVTDEGKLVYFPRFSDDFAPGSLIQEVDNNFRSASGFKEFSRLVTNKNQGKSSVIWNDQPHTVLYTSIESEYPLMRWRLGFIVPDTVIETPVNKAITENIIWVVITMLVVCGLVYAATKPIIKPIKSLVAAMKDISEGDGDLTKRIDDSRQDEIGVLAAEFNNFISRIQSLVKESIEISLHVHDRSAQVEKTSTEIIRLVDKEKSEIVQVASASEELAYTSEQMAKNTSQAMTHAAMAEEQVVNGGKVVSSAIVDITALSKNVLGAADVVRNLRQDSENVGEVLDVIRTIAEQTNLLALNAAIEAARAGEQGRGFAVVADEVRTLASRTQESTANIQNIIEGLRSSASQAENVMEESREYAERSIHQTQKIEETLREITTAIHEIQQQTESISQASTEQTATAHSVSKNVGHLKSLADDSVTETQGATDSISDMIVAADQLSRVMGQFKV